MAFLIRVVAFLSHHLTKVLRAGVLAQQLRPMHYETVGQEVHDTAAQAQRLDPAEALAEYRAGTRAKPEDSESKCRNAYRDASTWVPKS